MELQPGDKESHLGLGLAHYELTDFSSAKECFEAVLVDAPESAEALYFLGMSEIFLGDRPKGTLLLAQAEEHAPDAFPVLEMPSNEQFEELLAEAVELIEPLELREWVGAIPFGLFDVPPVETLRSAMPPLSPHNIALFVGEDSMGSHAMVITKPECIEVYRQNLMRVGVSGGSVTEQLSEALTQEAEKWRRTSAVED
jgi:tetratricopeptide (TPR) repeat protein